MTTISSNPGSGLISSPGIGSGIDVDLLVSKLVAAERKPAQSQIDNQRAEVTAKTSAIGSLKSLLAALKSSLSSLADGSAFDKRTASSSNSDLFTATTDADAVPGSYQIEVLQTAVAQKLSSAAYTGDAAVGTGTLTLAVGAESTDIVIDSSNNTLAGIRDAINGASDNPGVSATIVHASDGDHLVLTSTKTGVANAFSVSASGGDGGLDVLRWDSATATGNLSLQAAALDTSVKIDGFTASASGNVLDGIVEGVTINVTGAEVGQVETLTVGRDSTAMTNLIKTFVDTYNSFVHGADTLSSYNPDTKAGGPLLGDATLRGVRSQLAAVISDVAGDSNSALRTFGEIGVKLQADGTLALDEDKLNLALESQPGEVTRLFSGDAGYGSRMESLLDGYLGTTGLLETRSDALDARTRRLDDKQGRLDSRMQTVQDRYLKQFTALDIIMAQMNQTSSFLSSQLDALANIYDSNDD